MPKIVKTQDLLGAYVGAGCRIDSLKGQYNHILGEENLPQLLDCMLDDITVLEAYLIMLRNSTSTDIRVKVSQ